eukprot:2871314-Amphidinium_carterae.1
MESNFKFGACKVPDIRLLPRGLTGAVSEGTLSGKWSIGQVPISAHWLGFLRTHCLIATLVGKHGFEDLSSTLLQGTDVKSHCLCLCKSSTAPFVDSFGSAHA